MNKHVAVVGATGQIGFGLSSNLLKLGHSLTAVTRTRNERNEAKLGRLEAQGARVVACGGYDNREKLVEAFKGCDIVVVAMRVNATIVRTVEPIILEAANEAGVKRFVPDEFGCHTLLVDYGDGLLFDAKKELHQKIFDSDMDWTFVYNGVIFDYMVPNFRMWEKITTFGEVDLELATHDIRDITAIAARAVVDERTLNKAVQLSANKITQRRMIDLLRANWPDHVQDVEHISSQQIVWLRDNSDPVKISAKGGFEPDRERYGINYVVYVAGKLFAEDREDTLLAQDLYPDYEFRTPEEALADKRFVFGE